jgi:DNA-binding PucR family transcriptional regulator
MSKDGGKKNPHNSKQPSADMAFDPIEAALRQIHERVAEEQIPDAFLRLLDQLDDEPKKRKTYR